jgi:type I restriction enzyme S subunit
MASEWIECALADACSSIDYGLTASASDQDAGPKFLRITDIVSGHIDWKSVPRTAADAGIIARYRLDDGDVVLARTGASTGASAYVKNPPPAVFASYLVRLKAKPEFDSQFLAYYLRSHAFWAFIRGVLGDKSAQPNASASTMTKAPLNAPRDKSEQRAIAHILGTLDDKIELNRRMAATLEEMARALFKSWFVDFDPVRAKAEGRDTGLPKEIADLFPESFEESDLGEVPKGWSVGPLSELAELMIGGDWGVDAPAGGDVVVRCLRGVDIDRIRRTGWSDAPLRFISPPSLDKRRPSSTDVLVEGSGECGRALACQWIDQLFIEPVVYSNFCKRFRCSSTAAAYYVEFVLNALVLSAEMKNFVTGTAMPNLDHKGLLAGHRLVIPPAAVVDAFALFASAARRRLYCEQSRVLAVLRDALLPKLVSGEVRVIVQ